ncbi:hypothetical protein KC340_g7877 [Hortaea werneckii]|nr:hypothetical protein KC342_g8194 [Hortaea werneckii]KAI7096798.1 hypothetical protein KC339_g10145 [Hortaea werneckii]KAI7228794.1 hypothetical protein KC365_g8304 [Hortaea werneckii]KAI7319353.1 hypothetical protein KC340_g7877 [Hortaea werneckii]KAI7394220.1 hypothetical protein KC328_g6249 [Hortaea werneckii]
MAHPPPNDNPNHLLPLYTRVASAQTSLSLFAFPPTSRPSPAEIRSAYKTLALALHPDKAPPGREELHTALFQKVHAAFQDLVDPKEATGNPHDAAAEEAGRRRRSTVVPLRRIEDSLHARVHDFREWLKGQRAAELEERKKGGRDSKGDYGHEVFSEGWEEGPDVVVERKLASILAGSNACANLGLLLVEVAPSHSGHSVARQGKKAQVVDSWEEEEDRLAASVSGE